MGYKVFLNPLLNAATEGRIEKSCFQWQSTSSFSKGSQVQTGNHSNNISERHWICPSTTFDVASQRITDLYLNTLFAESTDEDEYGSIYHDASEAEYSDSEYLRSHPLNDTVYSSKRLSALEVSGDDGSLDLVSYAHTSTSSIASFPTFVIDMHKLVKISSLGPRSAHVAGLLRKVNVLVVILEVDGPSTVVIKKGPDSGKETSVLKLMIGDNDGSICKLTVWGEIADIWGGTSTVDYDSSNIGSDGVQKGDVVYIEDVQPSRPMLDSYQVVDQQCPAPTFPTLTASPNLSSKIHICYRTLPLTTSDSRFRPDLRLAVSDPGLRNVVEVVNWFQGMIGLNVSD